MPGHAFAGLIVLDMTHAAAGPLATMLLGDFGADILKIEMPGRGDHTRFMTMTDKSPDPVVGGDYFLSLNRNKQSITIDLTAAGAKELFLRLVDVADVLIENFRPGTMDRLGIGYEVLKARNERLIYCQVTGFGSKGPLAGEPGMDIVAQARAGTIAITGEEGGPPIKPGPSLADLSAGLQATIGILVALHARARTGIGQKVEVSLLESAMVMLSNYAVAMLNTDVQIKPMGRGHPQLTPYQGFKTRDSWIFIACGNNRMWRQLCTALGDTGLAADGRFKTNPLRLQNRSALLPLIDGYLEQRTTTEWMEIFKTNGVACSPILSPREAYEAQAAAGSPIVSTVDHPVLGRLRVPGVSIHLSDTPGAVSRPPPMLGEHTLSALTKALGLTPEQLHALTEQGVIGARSEPAQQGGSSP
jgi:crotonobetainyl-CoA:carnitine CoA-transferase CaiB-like acyl-CoA transferase